MAAPFNLSVEELTFFAVGLASALAGVISALHKRKKRAAANEADAQAQAAPRQAGTSSEPGRDYDLGRWHERERQDRAKRSMQLHHDLVRIESALVRQTWVLERVLDLAASGKPMPGWFDGRNSPCHDRDPRAPY
ncbi:MAG: hypothetical protein ACFB3T_11660 [Geminicoccaceae bacterium]